MSPSQPMPPPAPPPIPPPPFLDVPTLLQASQPRARRGWIGPGLAALLLIVLGSAYLSSRSPELKAAVDLLSIVLMFLIAGGMMTLMWFTVRRFREERMRIEAIEELVQLRRWQQAGAMLQATLAQPALTIDSRAQMLLFLSTVLARYNRFDDAIAVNNHLLETIQPDPATAHALHLGRAMAMLREDHLVDADSAITEMRREVNRANSAMARMRAEREEESPPSGAPSGVPSDAKSEPSEPVMSAGLALIEMYRDVKTGHPAEAIEMFNKALPSMRRQLGSRVGDAHALVSRAYDLAGDVQSAQLNWERATLLSPAVELVRRYPELRQMTGKYRLADRPADAADGVLTEAA